MATERNPFEQIPEDMPSVVPMESVQETETTETTLWVYGTEKNCNNKEILF